MRFAKDFFVLTIKGTYCESTFRLVIENKSENAFQISTPHGLIWLPFAVPIQRTYRIREINNLYATLQLLADSSFDAMVAVTKLDHFPTEKILRCSVAVADIGSSNSIERKINVVLPILELIERGGLLYAPTNLLARKLSKNDRLIRVLSPCINTLVTGIKATVSQLRAEDKKEYHKKVSSGEIEANEDESIDAISPDCDYLKLEIKGDYCSGEISWPILRSTVRAYFVLAQEGTVWLPLSSFKKPTYQAKHVPNLVKFLKNLSSASKQAIVPVRPTEIKPTEKTRKCIVDVIYEDAFKFVFRKLTVTLPEYALSEKEGVYYVSSRLMDGKLSKRETLEFSSMPVVAGMIGEIELLLSEVLETDTRELLRRHPNADPAWLAKKTGKTK